MSSQGKKIEKQISKDETSATYNIYDEDHTLGNALRYVLSKDKEVVLTGYTIPHPAENKLNLRIQTKNYPTNEVLHSALDELTEMCQHILDTFSEEVDNYNKNSISNNMN
eukprot:TRINITY_DN1795_c0_g1_i1.p1 TRINITY_DN1795_c0_g1~~TRINITY_DN1795_c0_g1_i1.p1  ORF type:complete len:110 (+),score=35.93 TRINITY_DN1795_c0_g1_i1:139-468(+)